MIPENKVKIIRDLCQFIDGGDCSHWYVGVTGHTEQHLFKELKIAPDSGRSIYRRTGSGLEAYAIAKAFWNVECQKSPHGLEAVDESAVYVFAYRTQPLLTDTGVGNEVRPQRVPYNIDNANL